MSGLPKIYTIAHPGILASPSKSKTPLTLASRMPSAEVAAKVGLPPAPAPAPAISARVVRRKPH